MHKKRRTAPIVWLALLASLLHACGPATLSVPGPTTTRTPRPSATAPQPTSTQPVASVDPSLFRTGRHYSDTSGDMEVSFLDVVGFQAAVEEPSETLEVVLELRDVPPTAARGQVINFVEYMWEVSVFLETPTVGASPDYGLLVSSVINQPSVGEGVQPTQAGTAELVPFEEVWNDTLIYNALGEDLGEVEVIASPEQDTLTLRGRVPGITASALFRFSTFYLDSSMDWPDGYVPPEIAAVDTPGPEATVPAATDGTQLGPVGAVRAYPGPAHYAGDVLTFEIRPESGYDGASIPLQMTLDDQAAVEVRGEGQFDRLVLPLVLDTTGLSGRHTVRFSSADGQLNETYAFEVLPASERPANEARAAWLTRELSCCVLHYIAETAAARDIEFITEHFEQAAQDFAAVTGSEITPKLAVYIIDTIWGNGGFGGEGELVISYTDRYYGPTIGGEGLETLARHEFTHAAEIGVTQVGDGVAFNYEGLAVYVAGGHYKPEPLAERGAALYDLGHYVPVGQVLRQHELSYLYSAAMLTYIEEQYGAEKMWQFLRADHDPDDGQPGSLEAAIQAVFGISLRQFDQDFQAWLESLDPGQQLDDLQLTVELQELRRKYQETYAPPPSFLLDQAVDAAAHPDYLPVVLRESRTPAHVAVELMIAHAQQAIYEADYAGARDLNQLLADVLTEGRFTDPLSQDYLAIALAADSEGYELVSLEIQEDRAAAQATLNPPVLLDLEFEQANGTWQLVK